MKEIDARGLICPQPVILTKKALDGGEDALLVRVDNEPAVENVKRLAAHSGCTLRVEGSGHDFCLTLTRNGAEVVPEQPQARIEEAGTSSQGGWAVFCPRDILGDGDRTLGTNLIRMYFYTLSQGDDLPDAILFMNAGVKLPTLDDQVVGHLKVLIERGVKVLICGACLDFYGLLDQVQAGNVSNMYDIVTEMGKYGKVVTL